MTQEQQEALDKLPVKVIFARARGGKEVPVLVDGDYDGEYFSTLKLHLLPSGYVRLDGYAKYSNLSETPTGTESIPRKNNVQYLHQLILPPKKGMWTRHINGNKLDNRSVNLEYMTPQYSALTRKQVQKERQSKFANPYRGVRRNTNTKDGKTHYYETFNVYFGGDYIASFTDPIEAAKLYDKLARKKYGTLAITNFKEE